MCNRYRKSYEKYNWKEGNWISPAKWKSLVNIKIVIEDCQRTRCDQMELPFIYDRSNLASFIKRNRAQSHGFSPDEKSVAGEQTTSKWNQLFFASKLHSYFISSPPPPPFFLFRRETRVCLGSVVNFLSEPCGQADGGTKLEEVDGQNSGRKSFWKADLITF